MERYHALYQTTASGDIEAMLEWNLAGFVDGYLSGTIARLIFATTSGFCCVALDTTNWTSSKKGYVAQANINGIAFDDVYLYVAHSAGIGRISLSEMFDNGESDRSSAYTAGWHESGNYIGDIDAAEVESTWYLVFNNNYTFADFWRCHTSSIYNVSTTAQYNIGNKVFYKDRIRIDENGNVFASTGPVLLVKKAAHQMSDHANWDDAIGNMDEEYGDGVVGKMWTGDGTYTESGGKWIRSLTASGSWSANSAYSGLISGDFDLVFEGFGGTTPSIDNYGKKVTRALAICTQTVNNYAYSWYETYYSAGQKYQAQGIIQVAGSEVDSGSGAGGSGGVPTDARVRVKRSGSTITCYASESGSGSWVELASYASFPTEPVCIYTSLIMESLSGQTATWEIDRCENTDPEPMYSAFAQEKAVQRFDLVAADTEDSKLLATFDNGGAALIEYDASNLQSSALTSYGASGSGADHEILTSNDCNCAALVYEESILDQLWIGTDDAGIDIVDVGLIECENINSETGRTLSDKILDIAAIASAVYAAGTTEGGGYVNGLVEETIEIDESEVPGGDTGDLALDEYGDFVVDEFGSEVVIDGMEMLEQDIRHRLMTIKGSLAEDAEYGASLPLYVHMEDVPMNRKDLINNCAIELAKEDRILPQLTQISIKSFTPDEITLIIQFVRKEDMEPGQVEVTAS